MAKPTPTPGPKGTNSQGRTYQEQSDYERMQRSKNIGKGEKSPLEQFIGGIFNKKTPVTTVAPGKSEMKTKAKKVAVAKKASKKGKFVIPASPTN